MHRKNYASKNILLWMSLELPGLNILDNHKMSKTDNFSERG